MALTELLLLNADYDFIFIFEFPGKLLQLLHEPYCEENQLHGEYLPFEEESEILLEEVLDYRGWPDVVRPCLRSLPSVVGLVVVLLVARL